VEPAVVTAELAAAEVQTPILPEEEFLVFEEEPVAVEQQEPALSEGNGEELAVVTAGGATVIARGGEATAVAGGATAIARGGEATAVAGGAVAVS
jgi:hypothetical protein